ncbi:MAG: hypothetical protein OEZ68_17505 [Gammaproteobacteria bacterium]|nr:hypothetical protein [Gammaproteobacteria bacterium]MDH5802601.1 hypothetical protein [Gammaproteobacteria bacterium]
MSTLQPNSHTRIAALLAVSIWLCVAPVNPAGAALMLDISPAGDVAMSLGESITFTATTTGGSCGGAYSYSMKKQPRHGSMAMGAGFAGTGEFSYTHMQTMHGKLGSAKETITLEVSCGTEKATVTVKVSEATASCASTSKGTVIIDNTATPGVHAIKSNLAFFPGCDKNKTTIETGVGGNSINIPDYQTMSRNSANTPHQLMLQIGAEADNVSNNNFGTASQLNYFAGGKHMFELNRLRSTADWLSANVNTLLTPVGTYGSISFKQFLDNIANDRTMYGIVRVKVGLEKGQCTGASCVKNALGQTVVASNLYGFCGNTTSAGECACAPGLGGGHFTTIANNTTLCGVTLPATAKIKVKGTLMWDFVDHITASPIALDELPFAPKELYFKVEIPIIVNGTHDADDNGTMDNLPVIDAISNKQKAGVLTPSINLADIHQSSKDQFKYETGKDLSTEFSNLNPASQYHLLMSSGYADSWAEAFDKLQLSAATWATLPPAGCLQSDGSTCPKFGLPPGVLGLLKANDIRSEEFEDIPAYLYTGGLVDMHDHVNISGLVYVPQALELEAKNNGTHQFINGGIMVRDGFFIEAGNKTITVISADPTSYSTARISNQANSNLLSFVAGGPGADALPSLPTNDTYCFGCGGRYVSSSGAGSSKDSLGTTRWMEIVPQWQGRKKSEDD